MPFRAFVFGATTTSLKYVQADVASICSALRSTGYDVHQAQGSKHNILEQLDNFCDGCEIKDTAIFYFSGHGFIRKGALNLALDDNSFEKTSLSIQLDTMSAALEACQAQHKILILDCCHALASPKEWNTSQYGSFRLLAASKKLERAKEIDDLQSSFLTYYFCAGLTNRSVETCDQNGNVSLNKLFEWIVARATEHNSTHEVVVPLPNLIGNQAADIILAPTNNERLSHYRTKAFLENASIYATSILQCRDGCPEDAQCYKRWSFCRTFFELNVNKIGYVMPRVKVGLRGQQLVAGAFDVFFERWSNDASTRNLVLLGDYGTGKTAACAYVMALLSAKFLQNPNDAMFPVFVAMSSYSQALDSPLNPADVVLRSIQSGIDKSTANRLVQQRKIVFVLDGFDEMGDRADLAGMYHNFAKLQEIIESGCRIIITCRTHFFASDEQVDEVLIGASMGTDIAALFHRKDYRFDVAVLQEFSENEIREAIKRRFGPEREDEIWNEINAHYDLRDLSSRAIMLHLIFESLPELKKRRENGNQTNTFDLYGIYVGHWLAREAKGKALKIDLGEKRRFIESVAFEMWKNFKSEMAYRDLSKQIRSLYKEAIFSGSDIILYEYDTRNASVFNRDSQGNYRFMHKSFMEYFVAGKCLQEFADGSNEMESWKQRWFDRDVANFIVQGAYSYLGAFSHLNASNRTLLFRRCLFEQDRTILWNTLHVVSLLDIEFLAARGMSNLFGEQLLVRAESETGAVLLRQYCRIIARFASDANAKELIRKVVRICRSDDVENRDNNLTYIRYYGGQSAACEALLTHLSAPVATYDRLLHIYVLEQIGLPGHAGRLAMLAERWTDDEDLAAVATAIRAIRGRQSEKIDR